MQNKENQKKCEWIGDDKSINTHSNSYTHYNTPNHTKKYVLDIRDGRVAASHRPVPSAGQDGDGALRNFVVFPLLANLEFFKYSQVFRDIFLKMSSRVTIGGKMYSFNILV